LANVDIFMHTEDLKLGRLYWGPLPLPTGGELIGLLQRSNGEPGAAIRIGGRVYQGNAGALRSTGLIVS
jgi:hypothetical protein